MTAEIERTVGGVVVPMGQLPVAPLDGLEQERGRQQERSDTQRSVSRLRWQQEVKRAFRDVTSLCQYLQLSPEVTTRAAGSVGDFALFAPYPYVDRIRRGDVDDPLLRQILPAREERQAVSGFSSDPVHDLAASTQPGVIRKYAGRALLIASGVCAVHCRYCFRREFPYADVPHSIAQWRGPLRQLAEDPSLRELILSGGDPLMLPDELLGQLLQEISALSHLRRLRIHTRLPIVIPDRVTDLLLELVRSSRWRVIFVLHANHPREFDGQVAAAMRRLRDAGAWLLNQTVLLKGVNDDLDTLVALSESLVDLQIVPYYLHQLDRVAGAAHFEVPVWRGQELMAGLQRSLPGYAVPRYVRDLPGEQSKQWLWG